MKMSRGTKVTFFLFPLQHNKRPVLHSEQEGILEMAFRAQKVFGTFEKWAPGWQICWF